LQDCFGSASANERAEASGDAISTDAADFGSSVQPKEAWSLSLEEPERTQREPVRGARKAEQASHSDGNRSRPWQPRDRPLLSPIQFHVAVDEGYGLR